MNITGLVHGNTNIYLDPNPGVTLSFFGDVSASGTINLSENPLDPSSRGMGSNNFNNVNHVSNVNPMNLPVGTNTSGTATNIAQNVLSILQVPPPGEVPGGTVGTNRLYNQVDLIILISNGNAITVTSGVDINGQATVLSNNEWSKFISTNGSFYDGREAQTVDPVNINVSNLMNWTMSSTNSLRTPLVNQRGTSLQYVSSIYIADERVLSNAVIITNISYTTNTATTTNNRLPVNGHVFPAGGDEYPGDHQFDLSDSRHLLSSRDDKYDCYLIERLSDRRNLRWIGDHKYDCDKQFEQPESGNVHRHGESRWQHLYVQ